MICMHLRLPLGENQIIDLPPLIPRKEGPKAAIWFTPLPLLYLRCRRYNRYLIGLLFIISLFHSEVEAQITSLRIVDGKTEEVLPFATVRIGQTGLSADDRGVVIIRSSEYAISDSIYVTYVGYSVYAMAASALAQEKTNVIGLKAQVDLPVVNVVAPHTLFNGSLSAMSLPVSQLIAFPQLAGQADLLKALQLLPGISGGAEGTAGLNIRGGNDSQTHLLIDGNAIYNANHIGGFLSSVPDFGVKRVTVYKGGVPSRFGGRLSGVVDIELLDGRANGVRHEGVIGTGIVSLGSEGEITDGLTYVTVGRFAYPTLVDQLLVSGTYERDKSGEFETFNLYDGIAKISYRKDRNRLSVSYFGAGDSGFSQFDFRERFNFERFSWFTSSLSLIHDYSLLPNLTLRTSAGISSYEYQLTSRVAVNPPIGDQISLSSNALNSSIRDLRADTEITYVMNDQISMRTGAKFIPHDFNFEQSFRSESATTTDSITSNQKNMQFAGFWEATAQFGQLLGELGVRYTGLFGTTFRRWEPRLKVGYTFPKGWMVNTGYEHHTQFVHRLRAEQTIFPNELWQLATDERPPATARQLFFGVSRQFPRRGLFLGIDLYQKWLDNLTESSPVSISQNSAARDLLNKVVTDGSGTSYGVEFYGEWKRKNFTTFVAYTWSKTDRRFPEINEGAVFPFTFDRRHDLAINGEWKLPKSWIVNGSFIYQSGRAITVPTRVTLYYNIYDRINNARFPAFHLLNLSLSKSWKGRKFPNILHVITFSTYNTYDRDNPFSASLVPVDVRGPVPGLPPRLQLTEIVSRSIELRTGSLFPLVPGISYRLTIVKEK